jgi:RND family efflux transporter MFP subunit
VDQGGEVFDLVDLSTVRVRVAVPESIIGFCQVGALAQVSVEALGKVYPGRISRVIPDADERARTFPVEIDLANAAGELKAGMFVRSAVPSGPKAERLVVPKDAVVVRGPLSMIYVVRGSEEGRMAVPTPVEILSEVMDHVAVQAQGLSSGDQVVVRGNEYMFGPTAVSVMSTPEGATTQPGESARSGASEETPKRQNEKTPKRQNVKTAITSK